MADLRYQRIVTAYHGCDASLAAMILAKNALLKPSENRYDWLGAGIYFWENGPQRAYEWAVEHSTESEAKIKNPAVLRAEIDLGICFAQITHPDRRQRSWVHLENLSTQEFQNAK